MGVSGLGASTDCCAVVHRREAALKTQFSFMLSLSTVLIETGRTPFTHSSMTRA
jgi:hypothetical protein